MKHSQTRFASVLIFFFAATSAHAQQPKSIFYMTREPLSVRSFLAHADKVDILSPNWYSVDSNGLVSGGPNPEVRESAAAFHKEALQLSIATIPNAPGHPGETGFSKWIYENWRGAYDLKAISQAVDFLCLMTYDQHTTWTVPGPVAGWNWTVTNLDYALKVVPPQKLALGIPLYGYHWFAGTPTRPSDKSADKPNPSADYISTDDALDLAKAYGGRLEWDQLDRTAWLYFYRDDEREWIFYTDARTFKERYTLVKDRGLRGFASWVLGTEDAGIWDLLPSHK